MWSARPTCEWTLSHTPPGESANQGTTSTAAAMQKDASGPVTARRSRQSQASATGTSSTAYSFAAAATPSSASASFGRSPASAATAATVRNAGHAS